MRKATIHNVKKIFAAGGAAAGLGLTASYLAYLAIVIFCRIPSFVGYSAAISFVLAAILLAAALLVVYVCGCWIVSKGKFSR